MRRLISVEDIAREIISVQPMTGALDGVFRAAKSEEELIAEGYCPVDPQTRLMWVKPEISLDRSEDRCSVGLPNVETTDDDPQTHMAESLGPGSTRT